MDDIATSFKDVYQKSREKNEMKYIKSETSSKWNKLLSVRHRTKLLQIIDEYKEQKPVHDILPLNHIVNDMAEELIENVEDFHLEGISNIKVTGTVKRDYIKYAHPKSQVWCQRCSRLANAEVKDNVNSTKETAESDFLSFVGKFSEVGSRHAVGNVFERSSQISSTDDGR